jgi:hypothetical protein
MLIRTKNSVYDLTREDVTVVKPGVGQEVNILFVLTKLAALKGRPSTYPDHTRWIGNTVSINPDGRLYLWMNSDSVVVTSELDI